MSQTPNAKSTKQHENIKLEHFNMNGSSAFRSFLSFSWIQLIQHLFLHVNQTDRNVHFLFNLTHFNNRKVLLAFEKPQNYTAVWRNNLSTKSLTFLFPIFTFSSFTLEAAWNLTQCPASRQQPWKVVSLFAWKWSLKKTILTMKLLWNGEDRESCRKATEKMPRLYQKGSPTSYLQENVPP